MSDVTEGSAKLNTLMRFDKSRNKEALPYAYKYRLDLQLSYPYTERTLKALKQVEEAIEILEKLKVPRWKVMLRLTWNSLVDSIQNLGRPTQPQPPSPGADSPGAHAPGASPHPETPPEEVSEERS